MESFSGNFFSLKMALTLFLISFSTLSAEDGFTCKTPAIADIVILVDGSWSIGRINFRLVRAFLEKLVNAFSVEFDKTRIGKEFNLVFSFTLV